MTIVVVDGQRLNFPDDMSQDEIKAVLREKFPVQDTKEAVEYSAGLQGSRSALQGLTFGFSDEVGAATAALFAKLNHGHDFTDAYSEIHKQLADKRGQFEQDHPVISTGLEVAGGLLTGGAGGAKVLGGKTLQNASNLKKIAAISGVGAVEGGLYGLGSSDQGERLDGAAKGAALGAIAAPVGAGVVNSLGKVGGAVTNYASDKLTKTSSTNAQQIIRDAADAIGVSGDDIAKRMQELGPQSTITDVDDVFRVLARAGMNRQGTMRKKGSDLAFKRQRSQQDRLMKVIEKTSGNSSEYATTLSNIVARRQKEAAPLYKEAFDIGLESTPTIERLKVDKLVKRSFNQGRNWAESEGDDSLMNSIHYAKQALDDQIETAVRAGEKNKVRLLMKKKNELLGEISAQNPKYMEAMEVFADESALKNALELGRDVLKKDPEEIAEILSGMTKGEQELFRLGGVKGLADRFDRIGNNADAVGRIMNQPRTRKQLSLVLGDDAGAFLKRAGIEEEFTQTRNALTGNSTTALQQQAGQALDNSLDQGMVDAIGTANPSQIIGKIVKTISKDTASPETINELGDLMFKQGMSRKQILTIFKSGPVRKAFGDQYDELVAPYVRGSIAPAVMAVTQ